MGQICQFVIPILNVFNQWTPLTKHEHEHEHGSPKSKPSTLVPLALPHWLRQSLALTPRNGVGGAEIDRHGASLIGENENEKE